MSAANQSLTVSEIARKVLELLGPNGENWCQEWLGMAADGSPTTAKDPRAVKRCLIGALEFLGPDCHSDLRKALAENMNKPSLFLSEWNNSNPFPVIKERLEMLAAMDELPR